MKIQLPFLQMLRRHEVEEIIRDLSLQQKGAKVFYAVDPYEIFDFCFPFNPSDLKSLDVRVVADDQAALFEIFFTHKEKPVLLPEYTRELQAILAFFERDVDRVYSAAEMIEELVRVSELDSITRQQEIALETIIQSDFNILLAVNMGIYSLGVERFQSVLRHRLSTTVEVNDPADQRIIKEVTEEYSRTPLVEIIVDDLESISNKQIETHSEKERRRRANLIDALAIDRLVYLNNAFEKAYKTAALKCRYIILYLSSAPRSRRIFSLPTVRESLPMIGDNKFSFLRTRRQVFAYIIHKSNKKDQIDYYDETIKNLYGLDQMLNEIQRLENVFTTNEFVCAQCILNDGSPQDCQLLKFCIAVKQFHDEIIERKTQIENLGLVNALSDYERLLMAKPSKASHEVYINLFANVFRSGIKDIAMDRMHQKQKWILIQSEITNLFKEGLGFIKVGQERQGFRSPRDFVTDVNQYLPTKPILKSKKYSDILETILNHYKEPRSADLLDRAYEGYLELASDSNRRDPEHELIRCYLYLAFQREGGEDKAYEYTKELMNSKELIETYPPIEKEYRYIQCWSARRLGRFEEADECAKIAIQKWNDDARFYHGRCLNTYAWLNQENSAITCPYTIADAIDDAQRAIELYLKDPTANEDVIAGNYNNLAYFFAWGVTNSQYTMREARENLNLARKALTHLKELVRKETWIPNHPEYFHTEAYLAYQEFLMEIGSGNVQEYLRRKLQQAKHDIDTAIELYPEGPYYLQLKDYIEKGLERISSY